MGVETECDTVESVVKVLPSPIAAQPVRYTSIWDSAVRKESEVVSVVVMGS